MGLIEGFLVLVGFLAVVGCCAIAAAVWLDEKAVRFEVAESDPYRDGLDAAARISGRAFEAERTLHQIAQQEHGDEAG